MTSIYDFGLPLVIGSFGLIGLFLICRILVPKAFFTFLNLENRSNKLDKLILCYLVVLGFSVGLLFEFISDKIASWIPVIQSEKEIRKNSLFEVRNLRLKMCKHGVISMSLEDPSLKEKARQLEKWILSNPSRSPAESAPYFLREDLTDLASPTYYACKGVVYQNPQYFSELMRIQDKIYFSRSIAIVSLAAICLTFLCALLYLILRFVLPTRFSLRSTKSFCSLLVLFFLLHLLIYLVSKHSYADYEASFVRRCYNYYICKLEFPNQSIQPTSQ